MVKPTEIASKVTKTRTFHHTHSCCHLAYCWLYLQHSANEWFAGGVAALLLCCAVVEYLAGRELA